jgi:hypothetical protein
MPILMLFVLTCGTSKAYACPNCKEAVSSQPADAEGMARGYNLSVLFMLAVPFSLLGAGSFLVARAARRGILPEL